MATSTKTPSKMPPKTTSSVSRNSATKPAIAPATKPARKLPTTVSKVAPTSKKITIKSDGAKGTPAPAVKVVIEKPIKAKKIKLVRDSFTIPKPEYLILDNLKLRAADLKHPVKKSELLRAGIKALAAMTDAQLLLALKAVPMLKTGRPSK